jgi:hypothetical protein
MALVVCPRVFFVKKKIGYNFFTGNVRGPVALFKTCTWRVV